MANEEAALLDLEDRRLRAMEASDVEALLSLLQDDHVHVLANGAVTDRAGVGQSLRNVPRRVEPREPKVRIYGDVAVMTGPQINHEQISGETVIVKLFVTQVARRADGEWKFVSMHATRLPD